LLKQVLLVAQKEVSLTPLRTTCLFFVRYLFENKGIIKRVLRDSVQWQVMPEHHTADLLAVSHVLHVLVQLQLLF
jgi:hypothetical protein